MFAVKGWRMEEGEGGGGGGGGRRVMGMLAAREGGMVAAVVQIGWDRSQCFRRPVMEKRSHTVKYSLAAVPQVV